LRSKESVDYEHPAQGPDHCGECEHFIAPEACEFVEGSIAAGDWCELFEAENPVMAELREAGITPTREAVIDAEWGSSVPDPWTLEHELELPEEVQDFSWLDKEVEGRPHPGAVNDEDPPEIPGREQSRNSDSK